jgi:predicted transcriptional regulator of viral defense system
MSKLGISQGDRALTLLRDTGVVRLRNFTAAGIAPETLSRLVADGRVERPARGLYRLADAGVDARHALAMAAAQVPRGVVCLTSALQFHGLTTHMEPAVWIGVAKGGWTPTTTVPRLRIVRFQPAGLVDGVRRHAIDGVSVPVTEPARTIVDCFRHRRSVGLAVALEGLRTGLARRRYKPAEVEALARASRIWSVLEPYLTALVADGE